MVARVWSRDVIALGRKKLKNAMAASSRLDEHEMQAKWLANGPRP